jgi:hypothetical protein
MDYYNCKLRLHGLVTNEVLKENVSAPEIIVLRKIHGEDAVVDLKFSKEAKVDDTEERLRLSERYDSGLKKIDEPTSINKLFGEGFTPLLADLPEFRKAKQAEVKTEKTPETKTEKQTEDKKKGVI